MLLILLVFTYSVNLGSSKTFTTNDPTYDNDEWTTMKSYVSETKNISNGMKLIFAS